MSTETASIRKFRFFPPSSKGATSSVSLISIFVPPTCDWEEFEFLPEEIHLTDVAGVVYQLNDVNDPLHGFRKNSDYDYDNHILILVDMKTTEQMKKHFKMIIEADFGGQIDIGVVEELRFQIAEHV